MSISKALALDYINSEEIVWFYAIVKHPWDKHYRVGNRVILGGSKNGLGSFFVLKDTFTHACLLPRTHTERACEVCRDENGWVVYPPEHPDELLNVFKDVRELMFEALR